MTSHDILNEAKRLYDAGAAIHWVKPRSKAPVESGWTTGPRKDWAYLVKTYREGYNVGVRTGTPSKMKEGFLACIDVDVKDPLKRKDAVNKLKEIVDGYDLRHFGVVESGAGNGSRHLYCQTRSPFKMLTLAKEPGFEICLYSDGRQMVLPPSIHPTGSVYKWRTPLNGHLPVFDVEKLVVASPLKKEKKPFEVPMGFGIKVDEINLATVKISDEVREAIKTGAGVTDRSGYLLRAVTALYSAGLNRDEILNVLTDKRYFLSACAYEHAKTTDRIRAAAWLDKYTVQKAIGERDPVVAFTGVPILPTKVLNETERLAQTKEIEDGIDWTSSLARGGKNGEGSLLHTIQNVVLILSNMVSPTLVRRNEFALRDTYSVDAPWGTKKNASVQDDDVPRIVYWLSRNFKFEPGRDIIYSALTVMACQNAFDPVRDGLDSLPAWDETPRLGEWLKNHFGAEGDADYLDQVFTKWVVAMVRRVYEPGAKFDWLPIFEGAQGVGKSSFGRMLVGDEYFLDWLPNLADKDSALGLQGNWVVELGELSQLRRNEIETVKAFITRTVDKFRPPHGRKLLDSPRRCVFFGTTNKQTYLADDTGNRRFKPVKVGALDFETLRTEREQLFAEAKMLYQKIYKNNDLAFELTGSARIFEAKIHQEKMIEDDSDVMVEAVQELIEKVGQEMASFNFENFRISDLFNALYLNHRGYSLNARNTMFMAKALKKMGGTKKRTNTGIVWRLAKVNTFSKKVFTEDFY